MQIALLLKPRQVHDYQLELASLLGKPQPPHSTTIEHAQLLIAEL